LERVGAHRMKTHEFIAMLWDADPKNECEVSVGNDPVRFVDRQPYYYDGRLKYVEYDDNNRAVKCGFRNTFPKVKIFYDTLEDVIVDNPEVEVDLSGYGSHDLDAFLAKVENWRQQGRDLENYSDNLVAEKNLAKLENRPADLSRIEYLRTKKVSFKHKIANILEHWVATLRS
jgi:hypothetical protein